MALAIDEAQSPNVLLFPRGKLKQLFLSHYLIGEFIGVIGSDGEVSGK
jgi:hypothetical protein